MAMRKIEAMVPWKIDSFHKFYRGKKDIRMTIVDFDWGREGVFLLVNFPRSCDLGR